MRTIFTLFFIIALAGKLLAGQDDRGYLVRIGQEAPDIELIYPDGKTILSVIPGDDIDALF